MGAAAAQEIAMKRWLTRMFVGVAMLTGVRDASAGATNFTVDADRPIGAISPLIYGVNPGGPGGQANPGLSQPRFRSLHITFERLGGNRWTAYNYLNNASNAGSDYQFESDAYLGGGTTVGGAVLPFLRSAVEANAGVLVTVPMCGYVAADFSGPQPSTTPPAQSSHFVPEFPTPSQDTARAANHVYQDGFVQLVKQAMDRSPGSVVAFDLDNEPDLWSSTHPEVHPLPVTYDELVDRGVACATMIKAVDPTALVYGPVSYGWAGFQMLQKPSEVMGHGNFIDYYLKQFSHASTTAHMRLLDALDLHWYPEATGPGAGGHPTRVSSTDTSPGVNTARMAAPRSLWDTGYVEDSWITNPTTGSVGTLGKAIALIPRMQQKITAHYPGTKLSFSEYNYGGGDDISGAVAEADVLGIFGKFGVFSANEWPLAANEPYIDAAFRMFRNYDGNGGAFGDTELAARTSDPAGSSIYASSDLSQPGRLTLILINRHSAAVDATVTLTSRQAVNYTSGAAYRLTAASAAPTFAARLSADHNTFHYAMPPSSVTTIRLNSTAGPQ
jgi:hypothetical protein